MGFVEVAVNSGLPHRGAFSYAVPEGMTLAVGDGVMVPFGKRTLQGIVVALADVVSFDPDKLKEVVGRYAGKPAVSPEHVALAKWIADYYLAPLFPCLGLMLPPGFEQKPLTLYTSLLTADEIGRYRIPERQLEVI